MFFLFILPFSFFPLAFPRSERVCRCICVQGLVFLSGCLSVSLSLFCLSVDCQFYLPTFTFIHIFSISMSLPVTLLAAYVMYLWLPSPSPSFLSLGLGLSLLSLAVTPPSLYPSLPPSPCLPPAVAPSPPPPLSATDVNVATFQTCGNCTT